MTNRKIRARKGALLAALAVISTPVRAVDLLESYRQALSVDPSMLAAEEAVIAGREKAVQGRALLKPQLTLSGSYGYVNDDTSTDLPPVFADLIKSQSSGTVHQVSLQLAQPVYNATAYSDNQQLHLRSELAEISYRNSRQELIQRVTQVYLGVLLAREAVEVTQAEKAAVQMQLDRAQARFDAGRGRITDVQEAQARYDSVLAREIAAASELSVREAQYGELTGVSAEGLAVLRSGFQPTAPQPDSLQEWQARGLDSNVRVLAKRRELAIATAEIDKYKLRGRPTIELVASYTEKGQNGDLSPTVSPDSNRAAVVGVQFSIPLYTGGALDSRLRESLAKKRQAQQELGASQRDARLQVQDAFLAVKTGAAQIAALEQSLISAQSSLEATTLGRDVGTRTTPEVLDAEQRVFTTQLDLAKARYDYLLGRVRLAAAVGELQEDALRALNTYFAR